ncbi:MAG: hypothetical protein ACPL6D_01745 [Thermodesulfobacteriota bacterium]
MDKKIFILLMVVVLGLGVFGCAGMKPTPTQILPVKVTVDSVERLNDIAKNPPFQPTDLLVFRVNFKLSNPNNVPAKVDNLYFEAKVDDGTRDKTIIQAVTMPSYLIPAGGEITWSSTEPFLYGGVRASYLLRGVGGEGGVKGAFAKVEELWIDLGADKRKFSIDGNITTSLPDAPNLGIVRTQFKTEFAIPKL